MAGALPTPPAAPAWHQWGSDQPNTEPLPKALLFQPCAESPARLGLSVHPPRPPPERPRLLPLVGPDWVLQQEGAGLVVPKCSCLTYSLGRWFPHQKRACLNFTNAWLWRSALRINMCFSLPLARGHNGLHLGEGGGLSESPLETEGLAWGQGLGSGQEEMPQYRRRGSRGISLLTSSRFTQRGAAPQRGEVGTLVSFLEKSREHEAEPGMKGTCLRGRKVDPPKISISSSTLFSIYFGSLSPDSKACMVLPGLSWSPLKTQFPLRTIVNHIF